MRYFIYDEETDILEVKNSGGYWFAKDELSKLGEGCMILHLCGKRWFTEEMFWELINYAKSIYTLDYSSVIFKAGMEFQIRLFWDNKDFYKAILNHKINE